MVTASYQHHERIGVSSYELDRVPGLRDNAEEKVRAALLRRFYPSELIQELRGIVWELTMRARPYPGYGLDDTADLRERLSVVTAQLAAVK